MFYEQFSSFAGKNSFCSRTVSPTMGNSSRFVGTSADLTQLQGGFVWMSEVEHSKRGGLVAGRELQHPMACDVITPVMSG